MHHPAPTSSNTVPECTTLAQHAPSPCPNKLLSLYQNAPPCTNKLEHCRECTTLAQHAPSPCPNKLQHCPSMHQQADPGCSKNLPQDAP
ncbi:uncharacterized [Tachysurus ichikawai]